MVHLGFFRIVWRILMSSVPAVFSPPHIKCISFAARKVAKLQKTLQNRAVQRRSFCWLTAKQREKSISLQETDRKAKILPKTCFTIFFYGILIKGLDNIIQNTVVTVQ